MLQARAKRNQKCSESACCWDIAPMQHSRPPKKRQLRRNAIFSLLSSGASITFDRTDMSRSVLRLSCLKGALAVLSLSIASGVHAGEAVVFVKHPEGAEVAPKGCNFEKQHIY